MARMPVFLPFHRIPLFPSSARCTNDARPFSGAESAQAGGTRRKRPPATLAGTIKSVARKTHIRGNAATDLWRGGVLPERLEDGGKLWQNERPHHICLRQPPAETGAEIGPAKAVPGGLPVGLDWTLPTPHAPMIPFDVLVLFITASVALAIAPGPDNIFVLTQSALHGRRAGVLITLGLCTGLLVHISAVALGVAAILQKSVLAFNALKMAGAGYLLYLAWQAFRSGGTELVGQKNGPRGGWALYARGIVMNVTNPKVAIFFLAFLPQFADPARGPLPLQIVLLGAVFMICALLVFGCIAWAASRIGHWLRRSQRAHLVLNRVAGSVFVLLAGRLALSRQ